MTVVVPNALALAGIVDGSSIVASDHRNNYAAAQVGVNGLIAMFTNAPTKGDLIVSAGGGSFDKLGVGTNGQAIVADSTQPLGVKWASVAGIAPTHLGLPVAGASLCASGANKTWLVPIPAVTATMPFSRLTMMDNGAGGTIDVGVYYTDDEATFTKLVSTGAAYTLVGGAVVKVFALSGTITPVTGRRWFVAACFSSTGAVQAAGFVQGAYFLTGASAVLPASITGASVGGAAQAPAYMLAV